MKTAINSFGILSATIGSFLVWRYLTEINFADKEKFLQGKGVLTVPCPTKEDVEKFKRSLFLSQMGLFLILLGGTLQIISNYMPSTN